MRSIIAWLLISCSIVHAFTLRGFIPLTGILSNITLDPTARISIDHGERYSLIRQDGSFEVQDLSEGSYTVSPQVPGYVFASYLLTLSPSTSPSTSPESSTDSLRPHLQLLLPGKSPLPISSTPSLPHPLQISPLGKEDYYTARSGVDVLGMLKSPLVLMMIFSGVMMFALPKLMASVDADPELKKEMAEARKRMTGMQNGLSSMLTGGEERNAPTAAAAVTGGTTSSGSNTPRGNAQRRRGR